MNIHEYQAKELLREADLPVLGGKVAFSVEEAVSAWQTLKAEKVVVKAQIHAGGRGAGHFASDPKGKGGVRLCQSEEEVSKAAEEMLGHILITKQTGKHGKQVNRIYIEEGGAIERELYLSLLVDRSKGSLAVVASASGGMDIEEVAAKTPDRIIQTQIGIDGFKAWQARKIAFALGLTGGSVKHFAHLLRTLTTVFCQRDAALIEINPLVVQPDGELLVMDAKMTFDDNALFRHGDLEKLRDKEEEEPSEREANEAELSYIKLDGDIACMVNGAGLAMATMDIVQHFGGEPANFLDVGGGADKERVETAFRIILKDKAVKAILVNIFGGIMRCDVIAEGIVAAASSLRLRVPLVVRLQGTNFKKGKEILSKSQLDITSAETLSEAAQKAVAAARQHTN